MAGSGYFKIVSKARDGTNGAYLAVAAWDLADENRVWVENEVYDNALQLWEKRTTRNGNGFALVNKARGLCIRRNGNGNGEGLSLASVEGIERDDLCVWRTEGPYGGYYAINSFADWEQKINIPGNGPYHHGMPLIAFEWDGGSINELWMVIEETAKVEVKKIEFDLGKANIGDEQPLIAASQNCTNKSSVEQSQSVHFRCSTVSTYRFEQTTGYSISETIEFTAGIPEIGEMRTAIEISGSYEYKSGEDQSQEEELLLDLDVKVPARKVVNAEAILLRGRLDVPYTVTFTVEYPGQKPVERTASGTFVNVKSYRVVTKTTEVGDIPEGVKRSIRRKF
jgi:hypothetical protein